jgi:AcrR family transcriptional regulator
MPSSSPRSPVPDVTTAEGAHVLRADAARNRARIVEAARAVFAERGLEASTADIAHRAGVGEATLFRRFPTKDDLITAIVQAQLDELIAVGTRCLEDPDPGRAVERFLVEMVQRRVADRGASEGAKDRCIAAPALEGHRRRVLDVMNQLVRRAQQAGALREDLSGQDLGLLVTAAGAVGSLPFPGLRDDLWKRYLGIILDGLRPAGATRLHPGPPPRRLFERPELGDGDPA